VYEKNPSAVLSLEEVKGEIVDVLKAQMREKAVDEFVDRLRSKAKIEEV
jgi:hypothetical protein